MKEVFHWIRYVIYFSLDELKRQHSRSSLGYFWIVLSQFVNIVGIAFVFGTLFKRDLASFFPYVSAGIISWNLLSTFINESTRVYSSNSSVIQNFTFPLWIFVAQVACKNLIIFAHGIIIHVLLLLFLRVHVGLAGLIFVPDLFIVVILMMMAGRIFAFLGGRFRDFSPAIGNLVYLFFLVTPIIWEPQAFNQQYVWLLYFNPFTHLIDLLRSPLIGHMPNGLSYLFAIGLFLLLGGIQKILISPREPRTVFYV
jgi:lipopolysaccharide transport system permease protein